MSTQSLPSPLLIPPGQHPGDSRVVNVIAGTIVPLALGSVFAMGRIYTRAAIIKSWGLDDTFITIAWFLNIVLTALNCSLTRFGEGHHAWTMTIYDIQEIGKIALAAQVIYQLTLFITKIGICLFYFRIFEDKRSRIFVKLLMIFLVLQVTASELMALLRCRPFMEFFIFPSSKCGPSLPVVFLSAISNILVDMLLIIFIVPRIWPLQMPQTQKILLLGIVSMGMLVIAAASVRLYRTFKVNGAPDVPYAGVDIPIWSSIEVSTGIFCASAPVTRPLLRKIIPEFISSKFRTRASNLDSSWKVATFGSTPIRRMKRFGKGSNGIDVQSDNNQTGLDRNYDREARTRAGKGDNINYSRDLSDYDSQLEVLNHDEKIVKTVSIDVTDGEKSDAGDVEKQSTAGNFERV